MTGSTARACLKWSVLIILLTLCPNILSGLEIKKTSIESSSEPNKDVSHSERLPHCAVARLGTTCFWHPDSIKSLTFSPDSTTLVSGGWDNTIRVWEVPSGREVRRFEEQGGSWGSISAVAFSPSGKLLASAGKTIRIRDIATGKVVHGFDEVQGKGFQGLAFSPDGTYLAAIGCLSSSDIRVWEVASGKQVYRLEGNLHGRGFLTYSPDGKVLAAGGSITSAIELWDIARGKKLKDLTTTKDLGVGSLVFSPDGKTLAAGCNNDVIFLWDVDTGKEIRRLHASDKRQGSVTCLAFSPDGAILASADGLCHFWDVATGKRLSPLGGLDEGYRIVFSPDGKVLATAGLHAPIHLWKKSEDGTYQPIGRHRGSILDISCSPDGKTVALMDGTIALWNLETGKELRRLGRPVRTERWFPRGCVAFSPDGNMLVAQEERVLVLWDIATGKRLRRLGRIDGKTCSVSFSADGKTVAVVELRQKENELQYAIHVWELTSGQRNREVIVEGHLADDQSVAFSVDGRILALGFDGPSLWDMPVTRKLRRLDDEARGGLTLALSPDGRTLAWLRAKAIKESDKKEILGKQTERVLDLCEAATGGIRTTIQWKWDKECCLALSYDGRLVASGDEKGILRLWDTSTGQKLCETEAHEGKVMCLRFAASGKLLISGSVDTTALVWDVEKLTKGKHKDRRVNRPTAEQLEESWRILGEKDAVAAYRTSWLLTDAPQDTAPFLDKKLSPVANVAAEKIQQLIKDLDAQEFGVRQRAEQQLQELGDLAAPFLNRVLEQKPSLEVRQRVERLLKHVEESRHSPQAIREDRSLEILERIASPDAKKVMERLASGASEARLTKEAKATLWRMKLRESGMPNSR